jgi:hypothetical protein
MGTQLEIGQSTALALPHVCSDKLSCGRCCAICILHPDPIWTRPEHLKTPSCGLKVMVLTSRAPRQVWTQTQWSLVGVRGGKGLDRSEGMSVTTSQRRSGEPVMMGGGA